MPKQIAIGIQSFEEIIQGECYYIDKTNFIKEWWENKDSVTLIALYCFIRKNKIHFSAKGDNYDR